MEGEKEVVDFEQLVRIFVDTDVDTHFIVSLPRTSTVFELRESVKKTHRHCYPDSGDVEIGKLAVPGGDYGYHLADFLLIGQVYDRYEGKVFAEVNSSQGLFRRPTLSSKTRSKMSLPAKQPFENGDGMVSANGSEPGALLAVGFNACELIAPKPQKEEIDEDGNGVGLLWRSGVKRIEEEEGEELVERPEAEVLLPDKIAVPSDIPGGSRKRDAPECNERPSKSRRLTEPKAPLEDDDLWNAAASLSRMNRSDDLDSNYLSSSGSKRKKKKKKVSHICDLTVSDGIMREVEDKETDLVTGSGVDGRLGEEPLPEDHLEPLPGVLAALDLLGKKKRKLKKPRKVKEPELEKELDEQEEEMTEKKEKKGKKKRKLKPKEPEQEMELDTEKEPEEVEEMVVKKDKKIKKEKKQKKQKYLKPQESQQEKVPETDEVPKDEQVPEEEEEKRQKQKGPEQEMEKEKPEEVEEMMEKNKKEKKEKERKQKTQKQKEPQQEKELEKEKEPEEERMEKNETKEEKKQQEQMIEEITPLDCPSLNPLLEESEREPQQEDGQVGVSPDLSDHAVHEEKDSDDDDVPGSEARRGQKKGDQDSGRPDFLRDEVSESGTPQREAQVSRDTCGEGTTLNGGMAKGSDDKVVTSRTNLFGDVNDMETSPSFQGGTDPSPQTQGTKTGSVKSQESLNPSKHSSYARAGRGAPSQTRSIESSRDMTMGKQTGGRSSQANESQSSQCSEKATQQSDGINLDSVVSGAWLRRGLLDSEPGQSQAAKPAHSRSSSGESSAESDPRFADQTELSRKDDHVPEASHINHAVKSPEKHASERSDGGKVNIKNDSLEFFSQDQSFHVASTQVQKALSGSTTEESSDESDDEDTDHLKKQTAGDLNKGGGETEESSDESGELVTPARASFPSLTTKTPLPTVSRMTGNGGSQSFKRRASGVAAEIEAKFAQFIESQGGLDEIMGISLGQRKRSVPVESSTQGGGSLAMPFGSPLDIALNTQESVKTSPIDVAQASQSSAGKYSTPQFKVPKPVPVGTTSGVLNSAAPAATPLPPGREASKARTVKELRLKRKEATPQVEKAKESGGALANHNDASPLPAPETFLDNGAANSSLLSPPKTPKGTLLDDLNASRSALLRSSEKKKKQEEKQQDSQFMIVNNTDHISEEERKQGSEEDGSLKSGKRTKVLKVKKEMVETGVVGSQEMLVPDSSGKKKKRKVSEKEGSRKKRMKFLPEDMDGKEVTVLPENSVERSARETEELYCKLEKANRDLWLQNNSVSSFRKEKERIGNRAAADLDDTEGGEDVAQSRLVPEGPQVEDPQVHDQLPPPSPVLCAGTTEASDREDSVFLSQDEKAETPQQRERFTPTDVFDYVSGDELPTKVLSKERGETSEKKKVKRMEELSGRAVQRVLEDEMLHVADASDAPGKNSRKGAKPVKWTVRMRSLSPGALATSPHGGTVPSDAEFRSSPKVVNAVAETKPRKATRTPQVPKPKKIPGEELYDQSGGLVCPKGCGRPYSKKTSAYYLHRQTCTGAPM